MLLRRHLHLRLRLHLRLHLRLQAGVLVREVVVVHLLVPEVALVVALLGSYLGR